METSTAIRQLAANLVDLELDNVRARAKYLDCSICDTGSIRVHVYNDVGGQHFLPYDTSSPLHREASYFSESLSARDRDLQRKVRSLSHDGLVALYEGLSQEIDEADEADKTNETDNQARSEDSAEGLSPLSELDTLGNDKRASHLFLR